MDCMSVMWVFECGVNDMLMLIFMLVLLLWYVNYEVIWVLLWWENDDEYGEDDDDGDFEFFDWCVREIEMKFVDVECCLIDVYVDECENLL